MEGKLNGRAWVFGDNVTTDEILPSKWKTKSIEMIEFAKHAFEPLRPEIYSLIREGDVIVGGKNFGYGSSREQAALAIRGLGVKFIIAESFARIFYRNCINVGIYPIDGIQTQDFIHDMDIISIHLDLHTIVNEATRTSKEFIPLPVFMESIVGLGGLIGLARKRDGQRHPFY
jgi:3-isopropylmalate/(R)-2-methylmalate dehydratase small subunit